MNILESPLLPGEKRPESDAEIMLWLSTHPRYTVVVLCDTINFLYVRRAAFARLITAADLGTLITVMKPYELQFFNDSALRLMVSSPGWEARLRGMDNLTII